MAKASPAFQFYPGDFLLGTNGMTAAAKGCYICMLASSWAAGPIADTPHAIAAAMCLTPFDPPYADMWREIEPKWVLGASGWTNTRLETVRAEQEAYRQAQADKGRKSAEARAAKSNHGSTSVVTTVKPVLQPDTQPDTQPEGQPKLNPSVFDLRSSSLTSATLTPTASERESGENAAAAPLQKPDVIRPGRINQQPLAADHRRHLNCIGSGTWYSCVRGRCVPVRLVKDWQAQGFSEDYCQQVVDRYMQSIPEGTALPSDAFKLWGSVWDAVHKTTNLIPKPSTGRTIDDDSEQQEVYARVMAKMAKEAGVLL